MSAPTVSQTRAWAANSHTLGDAALALDGKVDTFDNVMNTMIRDVDRTMTDGWKGDAARASQAATDSEKQISSRLGIGILDIADRLTEFGPDFAHACDVAVRAFDQCLAQGYTVADNGTVSPPPGVTGGFPADVPAGLTPEEAVPVAIANAGQHQADIIAKLAAVGQADADLAKRVASAVDALQQAANRATASVPVSPQVQAILDGETNLPTDPTALHAFWDSLSANEKAELWNQNRGVGNLDGIPAADRDHFNRRHLAEQQITAQRQVDQLGPPPSGTANNPPQYLTGRPTPSELERFQQWRDWHDKYAPAKSRLDALNKLDSKLNDPSTDPKFLIVNRDDGRAAVAINDPDTADNVSTYVPGTGTNLSTMSGDIDRSEKMVAAAVRAAPSDSTSVIAWQDYKAPQSIFPQAASIDYARNAAGNLDNFQNGLFATHVGDAPANTSVLGHSYGTTVVSSAATGGHILNADDIIMVASPGMDHGASSPSDFALTGVPSSDMESRFWSTTSSHDMINAIPEFVLGPKPTNGVDFHGAQQFTADPDGGHSDYWNNNNPALRNIGAIIAGQDSKVSR